MSLNNGCEFQVSELFTRALAYSKGTALALQDDCYIMSGLQNDCYIMSGLQNDCYIMSGYRLSQSSLSSVLFGRGGAGGPNVLMFVLGTM